MNTFDNATILYRGQLGDSFRLNEKGLLWVTPDLDYASEPNYGGQESASVFPLHIKNSKLFDYRIPDHATMLRNQKSLIFRSAALGNFRALQDECVIKMLKKFDFNGFHAIEPEGQPSIALFDLDLVKKAEPACENIDQEIFKESKIKLFEKYAPTLLIQKEFSMMRLLLKSSDEKVIGWMSAFDNGDNTYSVASVVAKKGFGKFMYAFAAMALYVDDIALTPSSNGNTNKSALRVWDSLSSIEGMSIPLTIKPSVLYRTVAKQSSQEHKHLFEMGLKLFELNYNKENASTVCERTL